MNRAVIPALCVVALVASAFRAPSPAPAPEPPSPQELAVVYSRALTHLLRGGSAGVGDTLVQCSRIRIAGAVGNPGDTIALY